MHRRRAWQAVVLTSLLLCATPCFAQAAGTGSTECSALVERHFAEARPRAQAWFGAWLAYALAEGGAGVAGFSMAKSRLNRDLWGVSMLGSAAFVAELALYVPVAVYAERRLTRMPRATAWDERERRKEAERLCVQAADLEIEGTNLSAHLLGVGWAAGTSAYLVGHNYRLRASESARRQVLVESGLELLWTLAVTELAIWTQPMDFAKREPSRQSRGVELRIFAGASFAGLAGRF
jgi:hypothetical protein